MVKLPVVLVRTIPFGPPLVDTLVSDTVNGVVPPARVISTAAAPVVVTVPLGMVMVWSVISREQTPLVSIRRDGKSAESGGAGIRR